jgi:hypothetical protein
VHWDAICHISTCARRTLWGSTDQRPKVHWDAMCHVSTCGTGSRISYLDCKTRARESLCVMCARAAQGTLRPFLSYKAQGGEGAPGARACTCARGRADATFFGAVMELQGPPRVRARGRSSVFSHFCHLPRTSGQCP